MFVEEPPGGALAAEMQHVEEVVVGRQLAEGVEMRAEAVEHDAMHIDAPILSWSGAALQPALINQARDEFDSAEFVDQRRVEGDFVDTIHDLAGGGRRRLPLRRIDSDDQ